MKRRIPQLSTTSTADISFVLLIFFLMTSSMDTDKGLRRQLPVITDDTQQMEVNIQKRNILEVTIGADNQLLIDGEKADDKELTRRVMLFVANAKGDPELPQLTRRDVPLLGNVPVSDKHVIAVQAHADTHFEAYFAVQDAIVRGYALLRDGLARRRFGHGLLMCTPEEKAALAEVYPQRISETPPEGTAAAPNSAEEKGGGQ